MCSGWGIRTLSTMDAGFNPIGYHLGTVWPHDTSIVAAGLARYGYRDEANTLAMALLVSFSGDPDRIRTCGPQIRNLMLYPAELRGQPAVGIRKAAPAIN